MVKTNAHGYTLVEMLMVVAIIGIVATLTPKILIQLIRHERMHSAKIAIQRDARACLDVINRFLRQAQASTVVIDQVTNQPPASRISFTGIDGRRYLFYQQGTKLYQVGISTTMVSDNLRYIAFTYPRSDDVSIISVALTMEKATYEGASKALELSIEKVRVMN